MLDLPKPFDLDSRRRAADFFVVLMAAFLPWSTTLFSVAVAIWWPIALSTVNFPAHIREAGRPEFAFPMALFALAAAGMLWSEAARPDQIGALAQLLKVLFLPLLIYQFGRTSPASGYRALGTFLLSCTVLMVVSWAGWISPRFAFDADHQIGVPVKNYITQAQEFVLCGFGCAVAAYFASTKDRPWLAALLACMGAAFILNLAFVVSSRTALISIPILALLGARTMRWRTLLSCAAAAAVGFAALWSFSPTLQTRVSSITNELTRYEEVKELPSTGNAELTPIGQRLVYWNKSFQFIAEAPLFGHGTGSIGSLFMKDSAGKAGAAAITVANPHNQILHAGLQWGAVGLTLLIAMWMAHWRVFAATDIVCWIGLLIVAQNILGSLFNSHLADFVEGWLYVLGVGVTAGLVRGHQLRQDGERPPA